jgi:hypothetical protein
MLATRFHWAKSTKRASKTAYKIVTVARLTLQKSVKGYRLKYTEKIFISAGEQVSH